MAIQSNNGGIGLLREACLGGDQCNLVQESIQLMVQAPGNKPTRDVFDDLANTGFGKNLGLGLLLRLCLLCEGGRKAS